MIKGAGLRAVVLKHFQVQCGDVSASVCIEHIAECSKKCKTVGNLLRVHTNQEPSGNCSEKLVLGSQFPLREYKIPPPRKSWKISQKLQLGPARDCPENCPKTYPQKKTKIPKKFWKKITLLVVLCNFSVFSDRSQGGPNFGVGGILHSLRGNWDPKTCSDELNILNFGWILLGLGFLIADPPKPSLRGLD